MATRVQALMNRGVTVEDRQRLLPMLDARTRAALLDTLRAADPAMFSKEPQWRWWWYHDREDFTDRLPEYLRQPCVLACWPEPSGIWLELASGAALMSAGFLWDSFVRDHTARDSFRAMAWEIADCLGADTIVYMPDEQWGPPQIVHDVLLEGEGFREIMALLVEETMKHGSFDLPPSTRVPTKSSARQFGVGRAWAWYVDRRRPAR